MAQTVWSPYCGEAPIPAELLSRWNLDPILLAALAIGAGAYLLGVRVTSKKRRLSFAGGWLLLLLVFVTPLCALSSALFSSRVAHHLLLTLLAAPLLVAAFARPPTAGNLTLWTGVQTIMFWVWHAPPAYAAALSNDLLYWTMQITLVGSALLFWSAVRRATATAGAWALLVSMVQMGLLGALITFAPHPFYAPHLLTTSAWGLTALEDQQIAGLLMWVPAAAIYLAAALFQLWRYLDEAPREAAAS